MPFARLAAVVMMDVVADNTYQWGGEVAALRPTDILYTLGSLKIGGGELRSLELLRALMGRHPSLDIVLYVASPETGPLEAPFRALGVRIVHGPSGPAGIRHLWRTCAGLRPSILHTTADTLCGFHCLSAALAGVPERIAHYRSAAPPDGSLRQSLILQVGRILLRRFATRVVGICDSSRVLAGVGERRWQTLYQGVAPAGPPDHLPARRPGEALMFVGRIHPEKDYLKAVDVFEHLRTNGARTTSLHVLGTGEPAEVERLRLRVDRSPYRDSIVLHGQVDDVREHMRAGDALLLPSLREGLPGAVLEALSEGLQVVASDLPGLREIQRLTEGVRLVPHGAPVAAWAEEAAAALTRGRSAETRASFERSPFQFEASVDAIERLWRLRTTGPHELG